MATLNFPDAPSTGDTYTDSNSGFTYEWNGTVWISKDPSTVSNIREIDDISSGFNGSTTAFTLQVASVNVEPANVQQLIISVGGVMQNAGDDYTVSGSTLTFTTAPTSGLTFFGTLLGTALSLNTVADGSVTVSSLSTTTNYIMGGLTADQNAGIITSYGLVAGAGGVNVSGAVTGGSFSGDGSGLTGVASTDNIITSYGATFLSNVRVAGIFTAANAYVTGILTAQTLNYNNVTDIYSTGIITATGGIQQTGNEGLHVSSGITTVGIFTATKATVGLAVTINNTGIDAGNAGIVTAGTIAAPSELTLKSSATTTVATIDTNSRLLLGHTANVAVVDANPRLQVTGASDSTAHAAVNMFANDANGPRVTLSKSRGSAGVYTVVQNGDGLGLISFAGADGTDSNSVGAQISAEVDGSPGSNDMPGRIVFKTTADGASSSTERLRITSNGGFQFTNGLFDEKVNITAGKLSDNPNIDLENGMVHYFTTQETGICTPDIRINSSTSLNSVMDIGDVCTVTLITTAAAAGYCANMTIDTASITEEWVGGEAPSAGGDDGLDIYTYTIISTSANDGDTGFKVIANLTNASN